jgi:hypothetical protein
MSTLYNRKDRPRATKAVYEGGGRPWRWRRAQKTRRPHWIARSTRDAHRRTKRHRRAKWQRVLARVRHEGGWWAKITGWMTHGEGNRVVVP